MRKFRRRAYLKALRAEKRKAYNNDEVVIKRNVKSFKIGERYRVKEEDGKVEVNNTVLTEDDYLVVKNTRSTRVNKRKSKEKEMTYEQFTSVTDAQEKVLEEMIEEGYFLVQEDFGKGRFYLIEENKEVAKVNKNTGEALKRNNSLTVVSTYGNKTNYTVSNKYRFYRNCEPLEKSNGKIVQYGVYNENGLVVPLSSKERAEKTAKKETEKTGKEHFVKKIVQA